MVDLQSPPAACGDGLVAGQRASLARGDQACYTAAAGRVRAGSEAVVVDSEASGAAALERFVAAAPGLREPRWSAAVPGLPTLPDLKKLARERRAAGLPVIDQSAGDIDDVGEPLAAGFPDWIEATRDRLVAAGASELRRTSGGAYGYPAFYQQQYPAVVEILADSWGIGRPWLALHTVSGRAILDAAFRGVIGAARGRGAVGPFAIVIDPLAWSGYQPLAADLDLELLHMPAVVGHGLRPSAAGLQQALQFARAHGRTVIAVLPVVPSNPSGSGLTAGELVAIAEVACGAQVPMVIDAFYSPLDPRGHAACVPMAELQARLAPEVLAGVGLVVGETKVTSSQNKTASLFWCAPAGRDGLARAVALHAGERLKATNLYPRPQEAVVAAALHTFPGGVHAAMGPRYLALDAARQAMRVMCGRLGIPLSIGGSFYGTAALVDGDGRNLLRDADGRPLADPREVIGALVSRYGLVGAPGGMFSPAPEAALMVRLTAAVTLADVERVGAILASLLDQARD